MLLVAFLIGSFAAEGHQTLPAGIFDGTNTYFFSVTQPKIALKGVGRPGSSRIQLQLGKGQVSRSMLLVTTFKAGVRHNVVKTWDFLQVGRGCLICAGAGYC